MNKQVKGDGVGSCRGLIGPKIKYFTEGPKKGSRSHVFQEPSCDKLIIPLTTL